MPNREPNDPSIHTSHQLLERVREVLGESLERPLAPGLYLVATPIGNLGDVSLRALSVLARANIIAAEDTRHSRKLLSHFGVTGELTPYHEHNAARERLRLLARIRAGSSVALISDAGTPLISDPGYKLVREALDAGLLVSAIPGPSAALAALTSSGLPTDTFLFAGFLPPKSGPRRTRLEELKSSPATLVFFEASSRVARSLTDLAAVLGPREAAVAKELTKLHEGLTRGLLDELASHFAEADELKGEFVIVVAPPSAEDASATDDVIVANLKAALQKESFRDAVRSVAENLNVKRSRVYELGLALDRGDEAP
ncbi:MAG: 16S rRNA (cytidine(1402)-2'-O)-methyltransferase [Methyloceanibacter sp.]|uniref:16S rRNA (cytidine(1402)-2'-O)-methyltransferase n=1 Tax=Methyloceanibacter sp. TaxID=1965321 RepID=UPI003D9B5513